MTVTSFRSPAGVDLELELARDHFLPGELIEGTLRLSFAREVAVRAIAATLVGTEWWQHVLREPDRKGNQKHEVRTEHVPLTRVSLVLARAETYPAGDQLTLPFQLVLPATALPTVQATVCGVEWQLEIGLDTGSAMEPALTAPLIVLQSAAALRATDDQRLAPYAAEAEIQRNKPMAMPRGTIWLEPVPLCLGRPFRGRLRAEVEQPLKLQEVRLELRLRAWATVENPASEEIVVWSDRLHGGGELGAGAQELEFEGELPLTWLPTASLPHGQTLGNFRIVLDRKWAPDPNLVRDVALCTAPDD